MTDDTASPRPARPGRGAGPRRRLVLGMVLLGAALVGGLAVARLRRADPAATYERALAALEAGRFDEAEAAMERLAREREPTALDRGVRARLDIALGRTDDALASLADIPESHALSSWAHLRAGQLESRRRRFRFAEAELRRALEREPGLVEARRELIYVLGAQLRRPDLHREFTLLSGAASLTPKEVWVWSMSRDLVVWTPGEHADILEAALRADLDDKWSRLALAGNYHRQARFAEAEATLAFLPLSDPEACAARADLALDSSGPEAAATVVARGPVDDPRLASIRGRLALGSGDAGQAVRLFEIALAHAPDLRQNRADLGRALLAAGRPDDAAPYLEAVRAIDAFNNKIRDADRHLDAPDPDLWRDLGRAAEAAGRRPEARAWYRLIVARDPLDAEAQRDLFRFGQAKRD